MTNDFDAARRANDPTPFTLFGQEWLLAPLPSALMREFLIATEIVRQWDLADQLIATFVTTDLDEWNRLVGEGIPASPAVRATKGRKAAPATDGYPPLSFADKKDLILWAYRQETGRPTGRFANS